MGLKYNNIAIGLVLVSVPLFSASVNALDTSSLLKQSFSTEYKLNKYAAPANGVEFPISAYVSDWGQYERQINIDNFATSYDRIIFSFMGLCGSKVGDPTLTSAIDALQKTCNFLRSPDHAVAPTDIWGDMQSSVGKAKDGSNVNWESLAVAAQRWKQGQEHVGGLLGQFRQLKESNPNLELAFSVGGWSLSEPFSRMTASSGNREVFIDSVVDIFKLYPMFNQIDIDWEYPGGGGALNNSADKEDGHNYELLISELRKALDEESLQHVKIAIAAAAPKDKIDAANMKNVVDAGVSTVHLMTYDFFGTGWAERLAHHTNLEKFDDQKWSTDTSVDYLVNTLGIDSRKIMIGYAAYGRAAVGADVTNESPLIGSYDKTGNVGGSFEKGVYEWYDIQRHFLSITSQGLTAKVPEYKLITDTEANADYIYNSADKFFMSLDTPRSVYAKGKYANSHNLGGMFVWLGDYDNGYLLNAAREGLGYKKVSSVVDMSKIIRSCGSNIDKDTCKSFVDGHGEQPVATDQVPNSSEVPSVEDEPIIGDTITKEQESVSSVVPVENQEPTVEHSVTDEKTVSNEESVMGQRVSTGSTTTVEDQSTDKEELVGDDVPTIDELPVVEQETAAETYKPSEAYVRGNVVSFQGTLYRAKWWTRGVNPSVDKDQPWNTAWEYVEVTRNLPNAEQKQIVEQEDVVTEESAVDNYLSSKAYVAGDIVSFQGVQYRAKWWTKGVNPSVDEIQPWNTAWEYLSK